MCGVQDYDSAVYELENQLERIEDITFFEADERGMKSYYADLFRLGRHIHVEVTPVAASVRVSATLVGMAPSNDEIADNLNVFMAIENGSMKIKGFMPAQAGCDLCFSSTHHWFKGFDVEEVVNVSVTMLLAVASALEEILADSGPVEDIWFRQRVEKLAMYYDKSEDDIAWEV